MLLLPAINLGAGSAVVLEKPEANCWIGASGRSWNPVLSHNGLFLIFTSRAANLVPMDINGYTDVFVRDLQNESTARISVGPDGSEANKESVGGSMSKDNHFVAFASSASNLVAGDTNGYADVFVHDLQNEITARISLGPDGSEANSYSHGGSLSAEGHYVAFTSRASNLVAGDTNGKYDVFVHDRRTGQTARASINSHGEQGDADSYGASISTDGRFVVFESKATNLVDDDTNNHRDVFVHDLLTAETVRISESSDGSEGNDWSTSPSISSDGRLVAFHSIASNLVVGDVNDTHDVFVHNLQTRETIRVSVASSGAESNDWSGDPSISPDGRFVAFSSWASNFAPGDPHKLDVFVHDLLTRETTRASITSDGEEFDDRSKDPSITEGGHLVAFQSYARNLVSDSAGPFSNIFLHDRVSKTTTLITDAKTFGDVRPDHPMWNEIMAVCISGLAIGHYGNYYPERSATRAEMAVFILKGMHGGNYIPPEPNDSHPFDDLKYHWAANWIEELYDQQLTVGHSDGTYRPESLATRAEVAVFLLKAVNGSGYSPPSASGGSFTDVADHWAEAWIEQFKVEGITSGYADGTYRPENQVTRAEMAVFLVNAFGLPLP